MQKCTSKMIVTFINLLSITSHIHRICIPRDHDYEGLKHVADNPWSNFLWKQLLSTENIKFYHWLLSRNTSVSRPFPAVHSLAYSLSLQMKAKLPSKPSVNFQCTTHHYISDISKFTYKPWWMMKWKCITTIYVYFYTTWHWKCNKINKVVDVLKWVLRFNISCVDSHEVLCSRYAQQDAKNEDILLQLTFVKAAKWIK
jgi:hypothetical protein